MPEPLGEGDLLPRICVFGTEALQVALSLAPLSTQLRLLTAFFVISRTSEERLERVARIELALSAWKAEVIAFRPYPHGGSAYTIINVYLFHFYIVSAATYA